MNLIAGSYPINTNPQVASMIPPKSVLAGKELFWWEIC